jgi:hypothetical protein
MLFFASGRAEKLSFSFVFGRKRPKTKARNVNFHAAAGETSLMRREQPRNRVSPDIISSTLPEAKRSGCHHVSRLISGVVPFWEQRRFTNDAPSLHSYSLLPSSLFLLRF